MAAAYKNMSHLVVEDIAGLMTQTSDTGQRAGIGFVVAHLLKRRAESRSGPRQKTPRPDEP